MWADMIILPEPFGDDGSGLLDSMEPFCIQNFMDLSRFCSAPGFHLSGLSFECQGAFPSEG